MRAWRTWKVPTLALTVGLGLSALLAAVQPGRWLPGWLAFASLLVPGIFLLILLWRRAGGGKALAWMLALALVLRIGLGAGLEALLPAAGTGSETQQAGYVFYDAYHRDAQAWDLAASGEPLWLAFSKSYSMDQYGGLLGLSAAAYRLLSPDAHRPLLIIVLAGLAAAVGVGLAWKAIRTAWDERMALPAALVLAAYPESVLLGSSQMREPFLITFIIMTFLGTFLWQEQRGSAAAWLAGGLAGLLLFSPGVAAFVLIVLAGWYGLHQAQKRIPWRAVLIGAGVLALALVLLWVALERGNLSGRPPLEVLTGWLGAASAWDIHLLEQNSGRVQLMFETMPEWLQMPFVVCYGLAQPVLPAAIADPTQWPWKVIGILRGAGWYALIPFLVYAFVVIWRVPRPERPAWLWLWAATWGWMILSAVRAGADQWDNPRYRVMMLFLQAALAAFAWMQVRTRGDPWLGRILIVEGIFLAFFSEWYASRYLGTFGRLPFGIMVACIAGLSLAVIAGGWWWDGRRSRRRARDQGSG